MTGTPTDTPSRFALILQLVRSLVHLAILVIITVWAIGEWPMPWPGLLAAIGFPVAIILVWALFLSPKPVLRADPFGQALIELLLVAGAVGALLGLEVHWIIAVVFGVVAAVLGYIAGRRADG